MKKNSVEKAFKYYQMADDVLHLESMKTADEKVRTIVFYADKILTNICQHADMIKIDLYDNAKTQVKIDANTWKEFVRLAYKSEYGEINDTFISKQNFKNKNEAYQINLLKTFIDNYICDGKRESIADKEMMDLYEIPKMPAYFDDKFNNWLNDAVETRKTLNKVLWPTFWSFWKAAYYVTNGELTKSEFKDLVDWEHYKHGGYPSENSKPKLWAIFDKFDRAYRLMDKYKFPQLETLKTKFGIDVNLSEPSVDRNEWDNI